MDARVVDHQRHKHDRISLFAPSLVGGGAERVMVNLANGIAERGFTVDLVLASAQGPYLNQVSSDVRVVDLKVARVVSSLPKLVSYLRKMRPKAMISALNHSNVTAIVAKKLAAVDTRIIATEHNMLRLMKDEKQYARKNSILLLAMKGMYPWADKVVAVSQGVADDLASVVNFRAGQLQVIFNPVLSEALYEKANSPLEHSWFAEGEPPVMVAVGRLEPAKDFPNLLRAFARLRSKHRARLIILGEGKERRNLEALMQELGIQEDVALPGFVANPYQYMKQAHLFVLSSEVEGLPTVLIEALALGTPVVATDCHSGPREILKDGEYGELVPVGDSAALADAMLDTLIMPRQRVSQDVLYPYSKEAAIQAYLDAAGLAVGV